MYIHTSKYDSTKEFSSPTNVIRHGGSLVFVVLTLVNIYNNPPILAEVT